MKNQEKKSYFSKYEKLSSWVITTTIFAYFTFHLANFSLRIKDEYGDKIDGLSEGYFGFKRDFSDQQWRNYRTNFPILFLFFFSFLILSNVGKLTGSIIIRKIINLILGLGFCIYLHGVKIIFLILFLLFNYYLTKNLNFKNYFSLKIWAFVCTFKILSEIYQGFSLNFLGINITEDCNLEWFIVFGVVILRVLSFSLEFRNRKMQLINDPNKIINKEKLNPCSNCQKEDYCQRYLLNVEIDLDEFNLVNYFIYIFYPPLYFSGPILTFNSFVFQFKTQTKLKINKTKIRYLISYIFIFVVFEIFNHTIFPNLFLTNEKNDWILKTPSFDDFTLTLMCFFLLMFLWLKFILIWRTARIFSIFDGIEPEENMNRCICNNYCFEGFWRAWHRSFNQWNVKYIFIPLGGSKNVFISSWIIFIFVALWHDLKIRLLLWAICICICLIPEILLKNYFRKNHHLNKYFLFRVVQNLGGGIGIILLIISNLIGFGMGHGNLIQIMLECFQRNGIYPWILIWIYLSNATNMMFHIREIEEKKGTISNF